MFDCQAYKLFSLLWRLYKSFTGETNVRMMKQNIAIVAEHDIVIYIYIYIYIYISMLNLFLALLKHKNYLLANWDSTSSMTNLYPLIDMCRK